MQLRVTHTSHTSNATKQTFAGYQILFHFQEEFPLSCNLEDVPPLIYHTTAASIYPDTSCHTSATYLMLVLYKFIKLAVFYYLMPCFCQVGGTWTSGTNEVPWVVYQGDTKCLRSIRTDLSKLRKIISNPSIQLAYKFYSSPNDTRHPVL